MNARYWALALVVAVLVSQFLTDRHTLAARARRDSAEANLATARADADLAASEYERYRELHQRGTIAAVDEETWRAAWDLKVFGFINLWEDEHAGRRRPRAECRRCDSASRRGCRGLYGASDDRRWVRLYAART